MGASSLLGLPVDLGSQMEAAASRGSPELWQVARAVFFLSMDWP